jgi:hypothetical protein
MIIARAIALVKIARYNPQTAIDFMVAGAEWGITVSIVKSKALVDRRAMAVSLATSIWSTNAQALMERLYALLLTLT